MNLEQLLLEVSQKRSDFITAVNHAMAAISASDSPEYRQGANEVADHMRLVIIGLNDLIKSIEARERRISGKQGLN